MKPSHPDYEFSTKVLNSMDGKGLMDLHDKLHRTPYHKLKNTKNTRSEIQNKILNKAFNYSDIYNNFHEAKEKQEYDYEGDMAMSQLKSIIANAQRMHDMLEVDTNLPEWVQSKITLAEDYITTAANYMQGEMSEAVDMTKKNQAKAMKAGANLKMDPDTGTPDHFTAAARRKKGLPEEVAVNSAGAGNIAGIGVGPDGEPGVKKKKKNVMSFNRFMKK